MRRSLPLLLLALAPVLASCSSAPVRRSPAYGPEQPAPTLVATLVVDYGPEEEAEAVDVSGMGGISFKGLAKAAGRAVKDDPTIVTNAIGEAMDARAAHGYVKELASHFQSKLSSMLQEQGFVAEFDRARAEKLPKHAFFGKHVYVHDGTSDHSFSELPVFGTGSKSSVVSTLSTSRPREAYCSAEIRFDPEGDDSGDAVTCKVVVKVLDKEGDWVYDGTATGSSGNAPGVHQKRQMQAAFDAAIEQLRQPVIEEI